jgi:nucleotidyltransferase substrate binding protein (TIGR01987 family)
MSNNDEIRWQQRFDNFKLAFDQLDKACDLGEYSDLEFAGLIKSFEIAFEMAWKTLKDLLYYEGFDVKSPRATIQQANELGMITDSTPWIEALESRNVLSHKYDKDKAEEAEALIKETYLPMLKEVLDKLQSRKDKA